MSLAELVCVHGGPDENGDDNEDNDQDDYGDDNDDEDGNDVSMWRMCPLWPQGHFHPADK